MAAASSPASGTASPSEAAPISCVNAMGRKTALPD
jgi:hypothetical protein